MTSSSDQLHQSITVDAQEVAKFSDYANAWWDPNGAFKPIHKFNPVRVAYIRDRAAEHFNTKDTALPLKGLSILDVGCGGGVLSEPLARLGATITGIDPAAKNIGAASVHAKSQGLDIDYRATTAEDLAASSAQFDIVLAMEVVEHVNDVEAFTMTCAQMVKPGGLMFAATINRTLKAYGLAIIGAEYVLRWLPKGTHQYDKFVKPSELELAFELGGLKPLMREGVVFNPLSDSWKLSSDTDVNYMIMGMK
jgi:2-polyprenyl-6-hydroxyphenyl methylase/3-demethylubiquinone-9 3-methyltransferase